MSLVFNLCSFNIGLSASDYRRLSAYKRGEVLAAGERGALPFLDSEAFKNVQQQYKKAQEATAAKLQGVASVYLLQEVGNERRPLLWDHNKKEAQDWLSKKSFRFFHSPRHGVKKFFGCAVAIDTTLFADIQNHSQLVTLKDSTGAPFLKDVAVVTATHQKSQKGFVFVSLHAPGCNLQGDVDAHDAAAGDQYCAAVAEIVSRVGGSRTRVIGGDMNVNPEKWPARFSKFQGYQILRSNKKTNVNPLYEADVDRKRELDFFLFSPQGSSLSSKVVPSDFKFNPKAHCSDHRPIRMQIGCCAQTAAQSPKQGGSVPSPAAAKEGAHPILGFFLKVFSLFTKVIGYLCCSSSISAFNSSSSSA